MEVYAAMVDNIDQNVGELVRTLDALGELDNTVFVFTSDNGASREGRDAGTFSYFRSATTLPDVSTQVSDQDVARIDLIGGPRSWPHYPRGWAMACNTPFRLYKLTAYRGGNQVPLILSWPERVPNRGQVVRRQYTQITDILPTLVDLIGVPGLAERQGLAAEPLAGASFAATIDDPDAPSNHTEQYIEVVGHRGYYRDGWEIAAFRRPRTPFREDRWELFDAEADVNQRRDLAGEYPDRVEELARAWEAAAWENRVFPLEEGSRLSELLRPAANGRISHRLRLLAGTPTVDRECSSRLISGRSFRILVDFEYTGAEAGVLVAHGDQGGGYVLFIEDAALGFIYNDGLRSAAVPATPLSPGTTQVVLDAHAPGARRWDITVGFGGEPVHRLEGLEQFLGHCPYEGIDVGIDRRSPVSWDLYQRHGAFRFSGRIDAVTYEPGTLAPDAGAVLIEQARAVGLGLE
jgi:arylsulfatase